MTEVARLSVVVDANVAAAAAKLKGVDRQFQSTTGSAKRMEAQMLAAGSSTRKAATGYTMLGQSAERTAKSTTTIAPAMDKSAASTGRLGKVAKTSGSNLTRMATGLSGTQVAAVGAAYAFGKSIKSAADFDSSMRNVNSIAMLSEGSFQKLKNSVLDLSGPTAQSPQTLAAGMYDLVSTGYNARDALRLVRVSAVAASAGLTDTATSTSVMTGVLRAYNLKASEAGAVSDDLFQTVNLGKINFEQLAQGIGPVLPIANALGVNLKQVGAAVALMTYQGVPAAESFTYLKGAMTQMVKPSDDLKAAYKRLGVQSGDELVKKTGNLQNALQALYKDSGGDKQKFAELFPDVRGLSGALQLTGVHARDAGKFLKGFNNDAGITNRVFNEQKKGQGFVFKQLGADIQRAAIDMGGKFTPALQGAGLELHKLAETAHQNKGAIGKVFDWAPTPAAIPNLVGQVANGVKAINNLGKGAKLSGVTTKNIQFKVKGDSEALAKSKRVRSGLMSIPAIRNISVKVKSDADVVSRKTRTALMQNGRPIEIKTKITRAGNASTVVGPKTVKLTADNSDVKAKADQAKRYVETLNGLKAKPKIATSSNAPAQANAASAALTALDGKVANTYIKTHLSKDSKAMGGATGGGMVRVGEQGPEVVALPYGSHVYTAGQTRRMDNGMGLPGFAKGGWHKPEKRKGEKAGAYRQRVRDSKDRFNSNVDRTSGIKDSQSAEKIANYGLVKDAQGSTVEDTARIDAKNVSDAQRHLDEAKKKVGKDRAPAVAAARAALAEAKKQQAIDAANLQATQDNTAAMQAHTDALNEVGKQLAESNRISTTTHSVVTKDLNASFGDWMKGQLSGRGAGSMRTLGPPASY